MLDALTIVLIVLGVLVVVTLITAVFAVRAVRRPKQPAPRPVSSVVQPKTNLPAITFTPPQPVAPAQTVVSAPDPESAYMRVPRLLTKAEVIFAQALSTALPGGIQVFAQVRLAGLIQVKPSLRRHYEYFNRIQAKTVDFVICDSITTEPRLVIELDDSSHRRPDRQERDQFVDQVLEEVGLPILHVAWQRSYDTAALSEAIRQKLGRERHYQPTKNTAPSLPAPQPTVASPSPARHQTTPTTEPVTATPTSARYVCQQCNHSIAHAALFCPQCGAAL